MSNVSVGHVEKFVSVVCIKWGGGAVCDRIKTTQDKFQVQCSLTEEKLHSQYGQLFAVQSFFFLGDYYYIAKNTG